MKKLSLKNLKLEGNDLLQREQLKTVFGGYGGNGTPGCSVSCTGDTYACCTSNKCYCRSNSKDDDVCNEGGGKNSTSCSWS